MLFPTLSVATATAQWLLLYWYCIYSDVQCDVHLDSLCNQMPRSSAQNSIYCYSTIIYILCCTQLFSALALLSCNNVWKHGMVIGRTCSCQDPEDKWISMQDQQEQLCNFRADVSVSCMSTWSNVKSWTNDTKNTKCAPSCRLLPGADTSKLITSMKFRRAYSSSLPASVHAEPRLTRSNSEPHLLATATWHMTKVEWKTLTSTMRECTSSSRQWSFGGLQGTPESSRWKISWSCVCVYMCVRSDDRVPKRSMTMYYVCVFSIVTNGNSEAS